MYIATYTNKYNGVLIAQDKIVMGFTVRDNNHMACEIGKLFINRHVL